MRKKTNRILLALAIAGVSVLALPGCLRDTVTETHLYTLYTPVFEQKSDILAAINGDPGQAIVQPGQIYIKDNFIYLNDVNKGIHVIDNSDPSHPVQTAFLKIPGNSGIAIRGNILYADMYSDLLSIDITSPSHAKVVGHLFQYFGYRNYFADTSRVLTGWITKDTTVVTLNPGRGLYLAPGTPYYTLDPAASFALSNSVAQTKTNTGIAGSEAMMTLIGDYLYTIPDPHSLGVIDIRDSSRPTLTTTISAGLDLETIFPFQDKLLLGSKEGVYVYSLANKVVPVSVGQFKHGTACDPVIADEQYAYVTLHSGTGCGGSANELDVLSAQDITQSSLVKTYPMNGPTGLGKDGPWLFVCDNPVVRIFDASDPSNLKPLSSLNVKNPFDLIAINHLLLVIGDGGLYEYDYHDPAHPVLVSHLPINSIKS
ncbi:MAG TPA: hypothetical protein VHE54_19460 [Puia sp.]|nr:hypothetical protein [Puia sp.]